MNRSRRSLLGMALLGIADPLLAGVPAPSLERELGDIVGDPDCELASLSVLAIRDGRISYAGGFGRRHIGPDLAADAGTLYRIASISKMMTTLGLMRLAEERRIDLDGDVSSLLGFTLRNPHFPDQRITLRHVLSHTSSLRDDAGYSWPAGSALRDVMTPQMWASNAGPGAFFTYCNLGWGLIGTVMERIGGERFDRLMRRLLLDPLGLQAGYYPAELPPAALAGLATLYRKRTVDTEVWDADGPWIAQVDDYADRPPARVEAHAIGVNATPFSPTGGLRISARGLGTVMLMLMNGGVHEGRRLLKQSTLETMFRRQWTFDGANGATLDGFYQAWGLGNQQFPGPRLVEDGGFAPAAGHLGDAYGLVSSFVMDRERRNGMIALVGGTSTDPQAASNRGRYSALPRFQERILTALYRRAIVVQPRS
jgi:CubicO group peptidase (beta-lactamase class C family)